MLAKVTSLALIGLDGAVIQVEVDISRGLPNFILVGLPDAAVQESRERVRAAIKNSGATFPDKRITVNLAPADLRKAGPAYDLPIAVGVLAASEQVWPDLQGAVFIGELSLDGSVRHVRGVLPMAALARQEGFQRIEPFLFALRGELIWNVTPFRDDLGNLRPSDGTRWSLYRVGLAGVAGLNRNRLQRFLGAGLIQ